MEEARPPSSGPPIALIASGLVLAVVLVVGLVVLRAVQRVEGPIDGVLRGAAALLQPRVEDALRTQVETLGSSPEAFLVAHHHRGRSETEASRTVRTVLDIPLGTSVVRVRWEWGVDLGIDLSQAPASAFALSCDERARRCVWTVPEPEAREPSVRTDSIRVESQGALLLFDAVEQAHRDEVLASLTPLTEQRLRDPAFWAEARDQVRDGLRRFAEQALAPTLAEGEAPPELLVQFASDLPGGG